MHVYVMCPSFSSCVGRGLEPRTLCMLGKSCAPELYLQPYLPFFCIVQSADIFFSTIYVLVQCLKMRKRESQWLNRAAGLFGGDQRRYGQH